MTRPRPDDAATAPKPGASPKADPIRGGEPTAPPDPDPGRGADLPSAGPHSDPSLINPDATPGAGSLPEPGEAESGSNSG